LERLSHRDCTPICPAEDGDIPQLQRAQLARIAIFDPVGLQELVAVWDEKAKRGRVCMGSFVGY
jgi:hypothetical protein